MVKYIKQKKEKYGQKGTDRSMSEEFRKNGVAL